MRKILQISVVIVLIPMQTGFGQDSDQQVELATIPA